jgi:uncharacterized membrane protein YdbT with pleckstrin-like domain
VGYVDRHLLPGERVVYRTRLHWVMFAKPAALTVAGIVAAIALWRVSEPPWLWMTGAAVAAAGALWWLVRYVELMTSEFAVTSSRLILKVGLISRHTTEILLSKVEAIAVDQGLLGRLLNFGDLTVTGTGGAREVFSRVRDPIGLRNHVQQASLAIIPESRPGQMRGPDQGTITAR